METIKDYLHLYIGCEVYDKYDNDIKILNSVVHNESIVYLKKKTTHKRIIYEFDLLLRPLSRMTEEEKYAIQFEKQCFYDNNESCHPVDYSHYPIEDISSIINEYRKRGYDCDRLIEKNLALDATKFEKEKIK